MKNFKKNDRVVIKDKIWNREFYNGETSTKRKKQIFRIHYFLPNSNNNIVKLKNDDGTPGIIMMKTEDLDSVQLEIIEAFAFQIKYLKLMKTLAHVLMVVLILTNIIFFYKEQRWERNYENLKKACIQNNKMIKEGK